MLKDRHELEEHLMSKSMRIIVNNDRCKKLYNYIFTTYNIPKDYIADLISMRKSLSEASEFELFCLLDGFENISDKKTKHRIEEFYTEQEIRTYGNTQRETSKFEFPLTFKMIEVAYDQWIGRITINQLMELRKAQLINYNVNAQRTMQRIVKGNKESYKISLNRLAISQIEEAYRSAQFIPNTLTLNIPSYSDNSFYYDINSSTLVINSLEHFDITDGYHRYIAACQIKDKDPDFDYTMELRIVNFNDDKAKQFIFQEDQKTKMKKVDSDSLNMTKAANIVTTMVNEDYRCMLQGNISRNGGVISFGELAEVVDYFYFKDLKTKDDEKLAIMQTTKELVEIFNILVGYDKKYLKEEYSFRLLSVIIYCFKTYPDMDEKEICEMIEYVDSGLLDHKVQKFSKKKMTKSVVNEIEKVVRECELYV